DEEEMAEALGHRTTPERIDESSEGLGVRIRVRRLVARGLRKAALVLGLIERRVRESERKAREERAAVDEAIAGDLVVNPASPALLEIEDDGEAIPDQVAPDRRDDVVSGNVGGARLVHRTRPRASSALARWISRSCSSSSSPRPVPLP